MEKEGWLAAHEVLRFVDFRGDHRHRALFARQKQRQPSKCFSASFCSTRVLDISCPHAARRTGCGVQLRVSTTTAPDNATARASPSSRHHPSTGAPAAPAATADDVTCEGTNLYYPALLSDALEFLGAGLCWRLDKASSALHLGGEADGSVAGGPAAGERAGERGAAPVAAGVAGGVWPLQGPSDPAGLLVAHVLRIDAGTMEAVSAGQVG